MEKLINFAEAQAMEKSLFIDVRSEGEFAEDHIPGAVNLPVLNDGERTATGIAYHQLSPAEARQLGLEIISPKLPVLVAQLKEYAQDHQIVLYCWRGGMRSAALGAVLDLMHIPVYRLSGGYKNYRSWINQYWQSSLANPIWVLCGNTGVGKTLVLNELKITGCQAIDLESLAGHRGSVFGNVGLLPQPSQKAFESRLWQETRQLDPARPLILECESKKIGRLHLPRVLHQGIVEGKKILLYDSMPNRVEKILKDYRPEEALPEIGEALPCLIPRLGKEKVSTLLSQIEAGDYAEVVTALLTDYYDPLYQYPNEAAAEGYDITIDASDPITAAATIQAYLNS